MPPLTPAAALEKFKIVDGFRIEIVAHEHSVHPVPEQALGELGLVAARAHEVAERPEYALAESAPRREQGGGSGS